MSFPKLKTHHHELTLPVGARKIQYRGWTAREENSLLLAKKAGTARAHSDAVSRIVSTVTDGAVDPGKDAVIDVVYAFLLSRARGVGEIAHLSFLCDDPCSGEVPAVVNFTEIEVVAPNQTRDVKVGETEEGEEIWVRLRNLSFTDYIDAEQADMPDARIFKSCVERMTSGDDTVDIESISDADWEDFYLSIPSPNLRELEGFFAARPKAISIARGTCKKCSKIHERKIEGLSDFT